MKRVVYSCVTGGYDNINLHKYIAEGWDYVYFTDNPELIAQGRVGHWQIRPLAFDKLDNIRNSRWHKVNADLLFPDYDASLWVDGNITINNNHIFQMADSYMTKDVVLAAPKHPQRDCAYDEAEAIKILGYDNPELVDAEMNFLKQEKYPQHFGLTENNIMFRQHNRMSDALRTWWNMIENYSRRDQLSFNYACWLHHVPITYLYDTPCIHFHNGDFSLVHNSNHNHGKKHFEWPYMVGKFISLFIPKRANRENFLKNHVRAK